MKSDNTENTDYAGQRELDNIPYKDGNAMREKGKRVANKVDRFLIFIAMGALVASIVSAGKLQVRYSALVEMSIARHNGQTEMEAMMNAKSSTDTKVIHEALEIVYEGKKPAE